MADLDRIASADNLPLSTSTGDFRDFSANPGAYGAVLSFGLIPILDPDGIDGLVSRVSEWLTDGGFAFVTAFTSLDPAYVRISENGEPVGPNSFLLPGSGVRTFLPPGEGPRLFPGFELVHHWEGMGPEHRHGDGPVHHHGVVEMVLRREGACGGLRDGDRTAE